MKKFNEFNKMEVSTRTNNILNTKTLKIHTDKHTRVVVRSQTISSVSYILYWMLIIH